ncbi:FCD domain-containing protein [Photobacterium sp. DNB23_23_1]
MFNVTSDDFNELHEFRDYIEYEGLKLAWKPNPKQLVQELCFILDKKEVNLSNSSQLDNQFHQTFISLCDNRYFKESYSLNSARMATARNH